MKKAILKEQEFSFIDFNDFIKEIKEIVPKEQWVSDLPWTGVFNGWDFTHEHNGHYILSKNGVQIDFQQGYVLCLTKSDRAFLLQHPIGEFVQIKQQ